MNLIENKVEASVVESYLEPFKKHGFYQIDTATGYVNGEEVCVLPLSACCVHSGYCRTLEKLILRRKDSL